MSKEDVGKEDPHIPSFMDPQIFLEHDPLFGDAPELYPPTDPEFVKAQRILILLHLELVGLKLDKLKESVEFHQELAACEAWTSLELMKLLRGYPDTEGKIEQIMIDRKIHQMDPDFSFSKVMYDQLMPSLLGRERPVSS